MPMRPTSWPLIFGDAFVRLAEPLTETENQLASGPWRASDLIQELGRLEELRLDLDGGSNGRTARLVLHDAHFADKLPSAWCPRDHLGRGGFAKPVDLEKRC